MRPKISLALLASAALVLSGALLLGAPTATAGCGCDHPPPGWTPIMPTFGSPGKPLRLNAPSGKAFLPGAPYLVKIGGSDALAVAQDTAQLKVAVPADAQAGPAEVEVIGPDWKHKYAKSEFTVMSPAPVVPEQTGLFMVSDFEASISEDGTLLVPFNLSEVAEATQFLVLMRGLPLAFRHDDVVFHNADGVDLTLFTLQVDDPVERQWGSYYGWNVEQDRGIKGMVYKKKVTGFLGSDFSDQLSYWRHEFNTYKAAHAPGGTHEVDSAGYHRSDGTLHVNHDHLILAISGKRREAKKSYDELDPLAPGYEELDVFVFTAHSPGPLEPEEMMAEMLGALGRGAFTVMTTESPAAYKKHDDDD